MQKYTFKKQFLRIVQLKVSVRQSLDESIHSYFLKLC